MAELRINYRLRIHLLEGFDGCELELELALENTCEHPKPNNMFNFYTFCSIVGTYCGFFLNAFIFLFKYM